QVFAKGTSERKAPCCFAQTFSKEITMSRLFKKTGRVLLAIFGLLLIAGAVAFAQEVATKRPLVKLFLTGAIERDSKKIPVEKAGPVKPGEVVSFTMNSVNEGSAPARQYRTVGQIPRSSTFIAGSALGDNSTQVTYSINGGQEFSATPMIEQKQTDGTIKKVAAPVSMYTQVRFEWANPIAAGGKVVASYQVRVK